MESSKIEKLADYVDAVVKEAREDAQALLDHRYNAKIEALEAQMSDSESGAYEGNVSDTFNISKGTVDPEMLRGVGTKAADAAIKGKIVLSLRDLADIDDHIYRNMVLIQSEDGKISGSKTIAKFIKESKFNKGIFYLYNLASRSSFISKQIDPKWIRYCSMVPLFMAIFKLRGFGSADCVPYSAWGRNDLGNIVPPNLKNAMLLIPPKLSEDEFHDTRKTVFVRSGSPVNPDTTYAANHLAETPLKGVPTLSVHMALQSWCASPISRNKSMILDPENWDNIPTPLITSTIMRVTEQDTFEKIKKRRPKDEPVTDDAWMGW